MIGEAEQKAIIGGEVAQFPSAMRDLLFAKVMPDGLTPVRYRVGYGGRGGGRTWNYARKLLFETKDESLKVLCGREYQNSIRDSVHHTISDQIDRLKMNYIYEVEQARIFARPGTVLPNGTPNGSEYIFKGFHQNIEEVKSTEGIDRLWVEEAKNTTKKSWDTLDPTVRKAGSEIWASFNPELETDETYQKFVVNTPPDAIVRKINWRDNPWFPDVLRRQMLYMKEHDYDNYMNIWEGECRLMLEGAVYADELRSAKAAGRICSVPYDPNFPVDVIFDLGKADMTAMWLRQQVAYERRMIGYYQAAQEDIEHYLEWLQAQRYIYGTIWLPHDAKAKRLGMKKTIQEQFIQHFGPQNVRIVPKLGIADGINATRQGFRRVYFDKQRCADGIQALSHYRYEVVDTPKNGIIQLSRVPVHDWASHGADAFRYEAICAKIGSSNEVPVGKWASVQEKLDQQVATGLFTQGRPVKRSSQGWMKR